MERRMTSASVTGPRPSPELSKTTNRGARSWTRCSWMNDEASRRVDVLEALLRARHCAVVLALAVRLVDEALERRLGVIERGESALLSRAGPRLELLRENPFVEVRVGALGIALLRGIELVRDRREASFEVRLRSAERAT